jgi:hypothetical protein
MAQDDFLLAVKSTIEKRVKSLADSLSLLYVDLDDTTQTEVVLGTNSPALVFEMGSLDTDPIDPLYSGSFHVGARVADDPSNYTLLGNTGKVAELFPIGARIEVFNESDVVQGPLIGVLLVGGQEVAAQTYDLLSGFRLVSIPFKAQRLLI